MAAERVLVIDDNALNAELAGFVLEAGGFQVAVATAAEQALVDIQLPGMNGLALVRLLKSQAATRDLVLIAFTAFAMKGDEASMRAAGCDGYIAKPIDVTRFATQVRSCRLAQRGVVGMDPAGRGVT